MIKRFLSPGHLSLLIGIRADIVLFIFYHDKKKKRNRETSKSSPSRRKAKFTPLKIRFIYSANNTLELIQTCSDVSFRWTINQSYTSLSPTDQSVPTGLLDTQTVDGSIVESMTETNDLTVCEAKRKLKCSW